MYYVCTTERRTLTEFLEKAAPTPPYEAMTAALDGLYAHHAEDPREREVRCANLTKLFARAYRCYVRGTPSRSPTGGKVAMAFPDVPPQQDEETGEDLIPFSLLSFEPLPDTPHLKIVERVYNPWRFLYTEETVRAIAAQAGGVQVFEGVGVAIPRALTIVASLRDIKQGESLPRQYTLSLHHGTKGPLRGTCV